MQVFNQLLPASFRGATFLIETAGTASGRKTVTHEYPNSDRRFVEDLGLLNKTFTMRGIITGDNYTQKKDALILALEGSGPGQLSHPFFGLQQVVAKPYTLTEDLTTLGVASFDLTFEIAQQPILPTQITGGVATISQEATETLETGVTIVADNFAVEQSDNFQESLDQFNAFVDFTTEITNKFITDAVFFDTFFSELTEFQEDLVQLLQAPSDLATRFGDLFTFLEDALPNALETVRLFKQFYDFGDDSEMLTGTTQTLIERQKNFDLVNFSIQSNALIINYRNTPLMDFLTVDEIDQERENLEAQYQKISDSEFFSSFDDTIKDLRVDVRQFFDDAALTAFKLQDFETKTIPSTVLVFAHYESLENQDAIISINNIRDVSFVSGTVELLTQ